jgi:hypothetical protein
MSVFMVKLSIELRLIKGWFYPCRTVVEHLTHNPLIKELDPAVDSGERDNDNKS